MLETQSSVNPQKSLEGVRSDVEVSVMRGFLSPRVEFHMLPNPKQPQQKQIPRSAVQGLFSQHVRVGEIERSEDSGSGAVKCIEIISERMRWH